TFDGPKGFGKAAPAGVAAQPKALAAAAWPCVCPAVAIDRRPRLVFRGRNRSAAPVFFTITMREPAVARLTCSYGSCVPFCIFVERAAPAVPAGFKRNRS